MIVLASIYEATATNRVEGIALSEPLLTASFSDSVIIIRVNEQTC